MCNTAQLIPIIYILSRSCSLCIDIILKLLTNLLAIAIFKGGTKIFKVGPFWLDASGGTKIFRVGPILPENMVRGIIFSSRNFGPRTNFSRTKIPVTGLMLLGALCTTMELIATEQDCDRCK